MNTTTIIRAALAAAFMAGTAVATAATPDTCSVAVKNDPVVIRMSQDEFRIAFGVQSESCKGGCTGLISYRAAWRANDGTQSVEEKRVAYTIPKGADRTIAVDRNFFDLGEARNTTDVVGVEVSDITCQPARLTADR